MKNLRVLTSVWGDQHMDWWRRAALPSLMWPQNKEALSGATWAFLSRKENIDGIQKYVKDSGISVKDIEIYDMGDALSANPHAAGAVIKEVLMVEAHKCLTFDSQLLLAPPDTIMGDGSIRNMREIADQRDVVVLAAHARVLPSIIDTVSDKPMSNAKLVGESFKQLHASWKYAEVGLLQANSWIGGVSWKYLSENLYAVQHRLPTPYLINFTPEDIVYFRSQIHWGVIDHSWPGDMLVPAQRQRLIGSSDGAFMAEITPTDVNIPPCEHIRTNEVDLFWRNQPHNIQNRMQSLIFRGEP